MSRRLADDEKALWAQVAASIRPMHPRRHPAAAATGTVAVPLPDPAKPNQRGPDRRGVGPSRAALPARATPPRPAPASESLDGSWDRRLSSGRVAPDMVVDLHGLTRDLARQLLYRQVADAEARGLRVILVITGKGPMPGPSPADLMPGQPRAPRGAIRADLPRWLGEDGLSGRIAAVRRAHPRHGGAGAAYLVLKRKRG